MPFKFRLIILLAFIACNTAHAKPQKIKPETKKNPAKVSWEKLTNDLEFGRYNPIADAIFSQEIVFFRTPLKKSAAPLVLSEKKFSSQTVKEFCKSSGAAICINANFFDEKKKPLGLVIKDGVELNPLHKGGSLLNGVIALQDDKLKIFHRKDFVSHDAPLAVQSGPILLMGGKKYSNFKAGDLESRRAGACIDTQGRLVLFCSAGEVTGPSLNELVSILLMPGVSCRDAINFDGGGSAQIYVDEKFVNIQKLKADTGLSNFIAGQESIPVSFALNIQN